MLYDFVQGILDGLGFVLVEVYSFLPRSPFTSFNSVAIDNQYLQWLAWIVPISEIIVVLQAWIVAVAMFYAYMVILRFVRSIE